MGKNYSYIYLLFIVLLAFQSAYEQNETTDKNTQDTSVIQPDSRIENLKKQAGELFESYDKRDVDKYIKLSHPKNFEEDGNQMNYIELVQYCFERLSEGSSSIENPSGLFEIDNQLFSVIPYKLKGTNSEKDKVVKLGSMVGVSDDNGKSWKFVHGLAFNKLFPDVAGMIQIPNEKSFVNGKEQQFYKND